MYSNYHSGNYGGGSTNSYPSYYTPPTIGSDPPSNLPGPLSKVNEQAAVALLQHLDRSELQHLLDNESKLQGLVDDLPQVKALNIEHDEIVATNKSLAEYNLSMQPKLENLKSSLASSYDTLNKLKSELSEKKAVLDSLVDKQSLDTILALLQTETAKTEEESEQLADSFCDSNMQIEEFLAQYLPKRTLAHVRRIKSERFAELIRDASHRTPNSVPSNSWSASSQSNSALPYPVPRGPAPKAPYPSGVLGPAPYGTRNTAPYPPTAGYGMPQPSYNR
ncbi:unnamed protein product [Lymnaea stagnalis]|uniref:VPS37 C-terminal domain-containing protein n=1 Tax=Lymnaea stagnalis TaxID=6523 RepID=A0AAV2HIC6_LYMST